ncbi:MAG: protease Do [Betaproteobacteria bacterium]|jgi:serine protease Do|nr:protease Do [Betaproteobacteria bacterium]MEA3156019.1 serine protease Do [Betaproteobacteria bacterium]
MAAIARRLARFFTGEIALKLKLIVRSLVAAGFVTALGLGVNFYEPIAAHARTADVAQTAPTAAAQPAVALPDFAKLVEQNGPAVVNISVTGNMKTSAAVPDLGLSPDDPMFEFFRRFQGPQGQRGMQPQPQTPTHGIGSGFIVSADGLVLTNAHVVQDASEVNVKLTDRREYKAKVLGVDAQSDIAVLKIEAKNLPTVRLGKADDVRVGEWVVAIGSPFGFENTVTSGIVSAKARALPDGSSVPFLQTDVAVNPGNSGGPLFNLKGEVIGINSQIYSRSGGYQGVSFAIPIETAVNVKDQLVQHGKVTRGRLGVTIQEVNQSLAGSFGLPKAGGALVSSVEDGSPAAKAGLKPGDVVLKIDGIEIGSSLDLSSRVSTMKPGTAAKLEVWRDRKPRDVTVSVGEAPGAKVASSGKADLAGTRLGVAVRGLSADEQKEASIQGGLMVEQVAGAAARAGIRAGDIILAVNGKSIKSADELKAATKEAKTMALLVKRNDARIFVPVELG